MTDFTQVGDFCPNECCADYGKLQKDQPQPNIKQFGKTRQGKQRYQCKTCGKTFSQTTGTIFYRRRTEEQEILETLALVAEGVRISSLSRAKGHKEDTILSWVRQAGEHAEALEEILLRDYRLNRGQLDGLWSYVGNKGKKKAMKKPKRRGSSGVPQ